jgi:bacteriocin-like protein
MTINTQLTKEELAAITGGGVADAPVTVAGAPTSLKVPVVISILDPKFFNPPPVNIPVPILIP